MIHPANAKRNGTQNADFSTGVPSARLTFTWNASYRSTPKRPCWLSNRTPSGAEIRARRLTVCMARGSPFTDRITSSKSAEFLSVFLIRFMTRGRCENLCSTPRACNCTTETTRKRKMGKLIEVSDFPSQSTFYLLFVKSYFNLIISTCCNPTINLLVSVEEKVPESYYCRRKDDKVDRTKNVTIFL